MNRLAAAFTGKIGGFGLEAAFETGATGITALFGPSGSGKTSILRAIAGLDRLSGRCALGPEIWQNERVFVPTHRRAIGYVFQEASLFPHLSVRQNLDFGWRRAGPVRAIRYDDVIELFGLGPLLGRAPEKLSGGERQRVALGRALLSQPKLLLLDEPLSGLDGAAKDDILPFFEALEQNFSIPMVLVSHDLNEVERLADQMVVLDKGKVVASGTLNDVLTGEGSHLRTRRDAASVLGASVTGYDNEDGLSVLAIAGQRLLVSGKAGAAGREVRVQIAARDVSLAVERPSQTTILNCLEVSIDDIQTGDGPEATVTLRLGEAALLARVTRRSVRALGLAVGQSVFAQVKGVSLVTGPK